MGIPPSQAKCDDSFPASWTGRCGNSFGGFQPCADLLSEVSSTQLGAYLGKSWGLAPVKRTIPQGYFQARRPNGAQKMDRSGGTRAEPAERIAQPSITHAGKPWMHGN